MAHTYATANAFRAALEDRINRRAREQGLDHRRLRNQVAFERFLARLFVDQAPPAWLLKGGFASELRLGGRARATLDLDIAIPSPARIAPPDDHQVAEIIERLQQAVNRDLGDWFLFRLSEPLKDLTTPPYGGAKVLVTTILASRTFCKFHLDVGLGDVVVSAPEWITGSDLLAFAGIAPVRVALLPPAQQFAEKLHSLTMPRRRGDNSRTKDLVDLVLLLELGLPDPALVRQAVQATFDRRQTHPLPAALPGPPASWRGPYQQLARACGLGLSTMEEGQAAVARYWQAVQGRREPEAG